MPETAVMEQEITKEHEAIRSRYIDSSLHTIQVDFYPYKRLLQREMGQISRKSTAFPQNKLIWAFLVIILTALASVYIFKKRAKKRKRQHV